MFLITKEFALKISELQSGERKWISLHKKEIFISPFTLKNIKKNNEDKYIALISILDRIKILKIDVNSLKEWSSLLESKLEDIENIILISLAKSYDLLIINSISKPYFNQ